MIKIFFLPMATSTIKKLLATDTLLWNITRISADVAEYNDYQPYKH